ncbi:GGDEF domain-containing protein [Dokdonella sp.]|uniref:GGDEF domain-containing protein n=1 Tax=Dokdonella sp. TaxID=2291710 RepID=UPI0025B890F8|nr:GGDEF domain-containing protein [Dokdonella sp.]
MDKATGFDLGAYRRSAVRDRGAAISEGRAALAAKVFADAPRQRMFLLWYMGGAAIGKPDLEALQQVLRDLEALADSGTQGAHALAGFLRAQRQLDHGNKADALVTALTAANAVPEGDSDLRSIASSELCWDYLSAGQAERALEHCHRYTQLAQQTGNAMTLARAQYMEAGALSTAKRSKEAIVRWREALATVEAAGESALAGRVYSGLAVDLNASGDYAAALGAARRSVAAARGSKNTFSVCIAQAQEARALLGLGRATEALATVDSALAAMHDIDSPPTVLELRHIKRSALLATHAPASAIAALDKRLQADAEPASDPKRASLIDELEQRYVKREQAVHVRELEQENRRKELDIEAARQRAGTLEQQAQKQRMLKLAWGAAAGVLGIIVIAGLLVIRAQRRLASTLHEQAFHDGLTRLPNRRALLQRLRELETGEPRLGTDALLVIDIDHFKQVNDNHGHLAGDRVLAIVAHALLLHEPRAGTVGRLGGEEFVILAPEHALEAALSLAEQVRKEIADIRVQLHDGNVIAVTTSIGVALREGQARTASADWFAAADGALYRAKAQGRDRVVLAEP